MRVGAGAMILLALTLTAAAARPPDTLLLEIWVNGATQHAVVPVTPRDGALLVKGKDLRRAGLALPVEADGPIDVTTLPGVKAALDVPQQRLMLAVDARKLSGHVYDLRAANPDPELKSVPGAILHYDLTAGAGDARRFGRTTDLGADLGLDVFEGETLLTLTGFARNGTPHGEAARLDTRVEIDDPAALTHLIAGDAISGAVTWSRAVRFAGLEYASDFALRPDLVTQPLPAFFGEAAVPTTVQVFSGNAQVFEQDVPPGPFEIRNLPIVSHGGAATVVTTDVLGRETTQTLSLYATPDLLAPGLTSFTLDAGALRRFYGLDSFSYSQPVFSGTIRHGLRGVTLEAHGEAAPHLAMLGGGLAGGIGDLGAVSFDGAASTSDRGGGYLGDASFEGGAGRLHLFGSFTTASPNYRDLASLDDGTPPSLLRWQLGASLDLHGLGTLAASWIADKPQHERMAQFLTASWSVSLPGDVFIGFTGLRDVTQDKWSAQLFFTVKLGEGYASSALSAAPGRRTAQFAYDHPADPDGGFGWRVGEQAGDTSRIEIDADWLGPHVRVGGAAVVSDGTPALRGDIDGALVILGDSLFATRDQSGAMALVETGHPGVHIRRENRDVAVADSNGEALLAGLDAHADNHLSVDPRDYPMSDALPPTEIALRPPRRGAVIADFVPRGRTILRRRHRDAPPDTAFARNCLAAGLCLKGSIHAD
jgi:outer membrane usher protein